jgi:hypothetical protein
MTATASDSNRVEAVSIAEAVKPVKLMCVTASFDVHEVLQRDLVRTR